METFLVFNPITIEDGGGVRLPPPPSFCLRKLEKNFLANSLYFIYTRSISSFWICPVSIYNFWRFILFLSSCFMPSLNFIIPFWKQVQKMFERETTKKQSLNFKKLFWRFSCFPQFYITVLHHKSAFSFCIKILHQNNVSQCHIILHHNYEWQIKILELYFKQL